jgi:hypothetical protein
LQGGGDLNPAIARLQSGSRIPIENIVCQSATGCTRWRNAYMRFAHKGGQSKQLHFDKLGKQTCIYKGEYRNWVWERPLWTVCVSKRGVEFDVPADSLVSAAWALWRDYLNALGL